MNDICILLRCWYTEFRGVIANFLAVTLKFECMYIALPNFLFFPAHENPLPVLRNTPS